MKKLIPLLILFCSCKKIIPLKEPELEPGKDSYVEYIIAAGEHYADKNQLKQVSLTSMNFKVKFDSSAIYTTADPANQYDINKLYGFSEGGDHHQNSARIGWAWNDGALRLYAYTYNNTVRDSKEISSIAVGMEVNCSISLSGTEYIFKVNEAVVTMPRISTGAMAQGYQLYPYFGGDEAAPAEIRIKIQDI